jgi:hypothetical protein
MPNASASARASTLPFLPASAERRATASRSTFADALTFAFDVAYRAPGSLSLAQRTAYGLDQNVSRADVSCADVVGRAKLGERSHTGVVGRAKLGETPRPRRSTMKVDRFTMDSDVVGRAKLSETPRPLRSTIKVDRSISTVDRSTMNSDAYFRFNARAGGTEIAFVVANGRVFAGIRSWTR